MSEVARIRDQFRRAFDGEAWHGPSVMALLEGVTAEQASWKDSSDNHSIGQLVSHLAFWNERVLQSFKGTKPKRMGERDSTTA